MPAMTNLVLVIVALGALYGLKELDLVARFRDMGSRRMALQVGGFSIGLIWGPALISALTGAFSGLAAVATTNMAGLTNISTQQMLVVGLLFVGLVVATKVQVRDD